ncbi:MAG: hypothetical protein CMJ75_17385 [Planctomycetaceae bacterium]|nr:hypothetical protein [Planctomycetaceae bacterium]
MVHFEHGTDAGLPVKVFPADREATSSSQIAGRVPASSPRAESHTSALHQESHGSSHVETKLPQRRNLPGTPEYRGL